MDVVGCMWPMGRNLLTSVLTVNSTLTVAAHFCVSLMVYYISSHTQSLIQSFLSIHFYLAITSSEGQLAKIF